MEGQREPRRRGSKEEVMSTPYPLTPSTPFVLDAIKITSALTFSRLL